MEKLSKFNPYVDQILFSGLTFLTTSYLFGLLTYEKIGEYTFAATISITFSLLMRSYFIYPYYVSKTERNWIRRPETYRNISIKYFYSCLAFTPIYLTYISKKDNSNFAESILILGIAIIFGHLDLIRAHNILNGFQKLNVKVGWQLVTLLSAILLILKITSIISNLISIIIIFCILIYGSIRLLYSNYIKALSVIDDSNSIKKKSNQLLELDSSVSKIFVLDSIITRSITIFGSLYLLNQNPILAGEVSVALFVVTSIPFAILNSLSALYNSVENFQKKWRIKIEIYLFTLFWIIVLLVLLSNLFFSELSYSKYRAPAKEYLILSLSILLSRVFEVTELMNLKKKISNYEFLIFHGSYALLTSPIIFIVFIGKPLNLHLFWFFIFNITLLSYFKTRKKINK